MSFPILPGFVLLAGGIRLLCFALSVLHIKGQINLFCIIAHNFFFFFFLNTGQSWSWSRPFFTAPAPQHCHPYEYTWGWPLQTDDPF